MTTQKIAVLVGSLRKESFSRKTALALMAMAPESLKMEIVDIGALPIYNQDFDDEGKVPPEWTTFREKMKSFDGLLFVTPEYNRSVPGVLKNALDVGSRPYGKSIWSKKPGAIVSVSPGALGGFGANHHLRQSMVFLDVPLLQQPEMYVGNASKMFDAVEKSSTITPKNCSQSS
jgi:chromate reductase